uniref:Uncharacterized protein n=1 Tax=Micrurus surinamensis TaxID=129470 RepID=A0A2D4PNE0_MICSU
MLSRTKLDLQKKNDTLEEVSQQRLKQEEENEKLKLEIEKLNQDKLKYHRELDGKLQTLTDDLEKMKLEKDTLLKELDILQGKLSNSNKSLEEAKDTLEKEKQRGKTAVAEIEKSCQEARHQLQLQSESIAKEQNELKNLLEKQDGISKQLATELDLARVQVLQLQGILKDKEKMNNSSN